MLLFRAVSFMVRFQDDKFVDYPEGTLLGTWARFWDVIADPVGL